MNNIRKFRQLQGYTLEKFAELSNLSTGYICHLEKGNRRNPSYKVMQNIAKALDKKISEVFEV